MRITLGEWHMK